MQLVIALIFYRYRLDRESGTGYTMYIHERRIMRTHIQKWGNSLALRIPVKFLKELKLHAGNAVNIDLNGEEIVIKKIEYNLNEMLDQITPENLHSLALEDFPQGAEEW